MTLFQRLKRRVWIPAPAAPDSAHGPQVTNRLTTWKAVEKPRGNVLLIINSPDSDEHAVAEVFDELMGRIPLDALHIIATRRWAHWLANRGHSGRRLLFATEWHGSDLELNQFLENPRTLRWILRRDFRTVIGSAAHNLYNEEIKDVFERRVALFLGSGVFWMHTLPHRYLYVVDLAGMLRRFGRGRKVQEYMASTRGVVSDLYERWNAAGRPAVADEPSYVEIQQVLSRHLGSEVLSYDERGEVPLRHADSHEAAAEFIAYCESVWHAAIR